MSAAAAKVGRPMKARRFRAKSRTLAAYDCEWVAVKRIARALGYKTPFDLFRALLRNLEHPAGMRRGVSVFRVPRRLEADR